MQIDLGRIHWSPMFRSYVIVLLLTVLPLTSDPSDAAEPGIESLVNICVACHGKDGVSPSPNDIPSLAGKEYADLVRLLDGYKGNSDTSSIMNRIMKPFSDSDIRLLSEYFSSL